MRHLGALAIVALALAAVPAAQAPSVTYRVTFPEPEHHWMQVEATFADLSAAPVVFHMSRSSPGRYAVHEFAKNVFALEVTDERGREVPVSRIGADEWRVADHAPTVRVVYKIFGDSADGTYLGIDTTHAHLNMPAAFLWAEGLDARPIRITFVPPPQSSWRPATQLFPTGDPWTFSAPNLAYFMDSPTELAPLVTGAFEIPDPRGDAVRFRVAVHGDAAEGDVAALTVSLGRLVRQEAAVFGEFPAYEPGYYTFLFDFSSAAGADGMEHRNSTSISYPGLSLRTPEGRARALDIAAHEFFHGWNTERIRPAGLEPFDLTRENVTCCLWLAEGFTEYYGAVLLARAGLSSEWPVEGVSTVVTDPARGIRTMVEMSEQAPFADDGVASDMDDRDRTYVSYYTSGAALALALDFSLRERSDGSRSLDDFMRALWRDFGKAPDPRPGYVARPYSLADLRRELAVVSDDARFADEFFDRFVEGHDAPDFARLLGLAGLSLVRVSPGAAWAGSAAMRERSGGGLDVGVDRAGRRSLVPFDTPLYRAGIDEGDVIESIDGRPASLADWTALSARRVGDRVSLRVRRRDGRLVDAALTLGSDPRVRVAAIEDSGGSPSAGQLAFRRAWLGAK